MFKKITIYRDFEMEAMPKLNDIAAQSVTVWPNGEVTIETIRWRLVSEVDKYGETKVMTPLGSIEQLHFETRKYLDSINRSDFYTIATRIDYGHWELELMNLDGTKEIASGSGGTPENMGAFFFKLLREFGCDLHEEF